MPNIRRDAPGFKTIGSNLAPVVVKKHRLNRKSHKKSVNLPATGDEKRFPGRKGSPADKAFRALPPGACDFLHGVILTF